jgi:DNA-binding IclR family transcriptional regulator
MPQNSIYPILAVLEEKKYTPRCGEGSAYSLGFRLLEFGSLATSSLEIRKEAMPLLRNLVGRGMEISPSPDRRESARNKKNL